MPAQVSNYAKPGHRCRHNQAYWAGVPYYAFGMGAASYLQGRRFTRPAKLDKYMSWVQGLAAGQDPHAPQAPEQTKVGQRCRL